MGVSQSKKKYIQKYDLIKGVNLGVLFTSIKKKKKIAMTIIETTLRAYLHSGHSINTQKK